MDVTEGNGIPFRIVVNTHFNIQGREKLLYEVAEYKNVPLSELEPSNLYKLPIPDHYINKHLFTVELEKIIFSHGKQRQENAFHYYLKTNEGRINSSVPDKEFLEQNPNPVDIINNLFRSNNIHYIIKGIDLGEYSSETTYTFFLYNQSNEKINFNRLSSGEQIIIGLIIKCFIPIYYRQNIKTPPLLILDEPDAHLHPEMSKLLIDVLYKSFVQDLGIKVIITTHSPSTVALAPDDSIYEIKNGPNTSLKKVSKDYALKLLTENIPTLNIDYKSHRQIFVESPTDANYYRNIFTKIHADKQTTFQLYFISNGYGKGNCDHVKSIVSELRKAGNTTCYGIIDWDNKNASSKEGYIYVHGEGLKYSIENYLYNPLYLAVLFLEQGGANNICTELNIDKSTYNHYNIGNEPNERLQEISDWIINKIESKFSFVDKTKIPIKFLNDKEISIPKWYTTIRGHDLYSKIKEVFPSLQKFNTEIELSDKLTETVAKCYPLIDLETVKLLAEIAEP